nr:methyltransferase domain-containing protein [Blastocatellia bacterium]
MLVVGCGDGIEAAILARELGSKVVGIDVVDAFNEIASHAAHLRLGDATDLEFENERFDFVFSYHALEHISDPDQAFARNASGAEARSRLLDRHAEQDAPRGIYRCKRRDDVRENTLEPERLSCTHARKISK